MARSIVRRRLGTVLFGEAFLLRLIRTKLLTCLYSVDSDSPSSYQFVVQATNINDCPAAGCIRPVGLAWDAASARLYVSSDASGEVSFRNICMMSFY